jgi:hypothetical protein
MIHHRSVDLDMKLSSRLAGIAAGKKSMIGEICYVMGRRQGISPRYGIARSNPTKSVNEIDFFRKYFSANIDAPADGAALSGIRI